MKLKEKVDLALKEIRPFLNSDGGDVSLIAIDEKNLIVKIKLIGNCYSCDINQMTLKYGINAIIKKHAPEIKEVINLN